jgi:hypothetical protein
MKRIHPGGCLLLVVLLLGSAGPAFGLSYFGYNDFGGSWYDAEKTLGNTEDDLMCWAATGSNMLTYTGWGFPVGASFSNEDDIFAYFQNHWTDAGGNMFFGTNWWFDGINDSQGWSGWSQVDVPGGGYYTDNNFFDYYTWSSNDSTALSVIDTYLHQGHGVGLTVLGPGAHAITAWGYEYDAFGNYKGIFVTDSDNSKYMNSPLDILSYYDVKYDPAKGDWFLQDFYDSNSWYISEVHGLAQMPGNPVPVPSTMLLLGTGLFCLIGIRRKKLLRR